MLNLNNAESKIEIIKKELNLDVSTWGIANHVITKRKIKAIQFYDYDGEKLNNYVLEQVLSIFPYDCVIFRTKHGFHFISFTILENWLIARKRAAILSKILENQDYYTEQPELVLRIAPKVKSGEIVSPAPRFYTLAKMCKNQLLSGKHLDFYHKKLGLPNKIYNLYLERNRVANYAIKYVRYKTRD